MIRWVLNHFQEKVEMVKNIYSSKLRDNIQLILNNTLNCDRFVYMSSEFVFSVKDEFGKEDKSEGPNLTFIIILFVIIFAAIFFLFPYLLNVLG